MFSEGMISRGARTTGRDHKERRGNRRFASVLALGVASFGIASFVGCSPSQLMVRERVAVRDLEQADAAQARRLAPYEITLSRLYLAKAREAAGEAHYALALELAARSSASARRARALALARANSAQGAIAE